MSHHLLIVSHAPSPRTALLAEAVLRGAMAGGESQARLLSPFETTPAHVLSAAGIILGTTENFGYMNGALKDFFERVYYPCLEHASGLPYALFIRAGNDGSGARSSVERIVAGLAWKAVQPPLICSGPWQDDFKQQCETLGMTMAAGLEAGIF